MERTYTQLQVAALFECWLMFQLAKNGIDTFRLSGSFPCDILTTSGIRIEVKTAKLTNISGKTDGYQFMLSQRQSRTGTSDFVVLFGHKNYIPEKSEFWVIPTKDCEEFNLSNIGIYIDKKTNWYRSTRGYDVDNTRNVILPIIKEHNSRISQ